MKRDEDKESHHIFQRKKSRLDFIRIIPKGLAEGWRPWTTSHDDGSTETWTKLGK